MKFLLDSGVPRSIQDFLTQAGFDVLRLSQTKLLDAADAKVFSFSQKQGRILVTRDKGFGNLLEYPPGTHKGIIVIRDHNLSAVKITRIFKKAWSQLDEGKIPGSLIIISRKKVRIRRS